MSETWERQGEQFRLNFTYTVPLTDPASHDRACEKILARLHVVLASQKLEAVGEIRVSNQVRVVYHATCRVRLMEAVRTSTERCEVMDLPVGQCAHCRKLTDPDLEPPTNARARGDRFCGPGFAAKYAGKCYACDARWVPGDTIHQLVREGEVTFDYVCHECAW